MYCGNNLANKKLLNNQLQLGTRYTCMKKGIGQGKNMPFDNSYLDLYIPIDDTKIYCGNNDVLPIGYDRFGSLNQCLSKGIGIGLKKNADDIIKKISNERITKPELSKICKELKIRGYSRLNKDGLLNLVLNKINA